MLKVSVFKSHLSLDSPLRTIFINGMTGNFTLQMVTH